jgi:hypothetical protein
MRKQHKLLISVEEAAIRKTKKKSDLITGRIIRRLKALKPREGLHTEKERKHYPNAEES